MYTYFVRNTVSRRALEPLLQNKMPMPWGRIVFVRDTRRD